MINKILDIITGDKKGMDEELKKIILAEAGEPEPELRIVGLFSDISEEKIADLIHGMLYLNEQNINSEEKKPIDFYICTYGGSADDMFGMYDIMRNIRDTTEIHTCGIGKVMSAGVLLLASGTKGKRKIGKNCRVMVHSVVGGNHGSLHNMMNEMEAIEQIQKMYVDCLVKETNMTKKQLKNMLERKINVYLSAEEAVELGIADIII
jgi:ATP-dependent Clp protease protease subunit